MVSRAHKTLQNRWLWLAVAAVLLLLVFNNINWVEVAGSFQNLRSWQLFTLLAVNIAVLGIQYGRWALILHTMGHPISFNHIYRIGLAGLAISYFTPSPQVGGEPVQVYLLHKRHQVPLTTATASVTIDKTLMVVSNFFFLFVGILIVVQSQLFSAAVGTQLIVVGLGLMGLPLGLLVSWWRGRLPITKFIHYVNKLLTSAWLMRLIPTVRQTEEQICTFYREYPRSFLLALMLSMVGWLTLAGEYWLMASYVGLTMTLTQTVFLLTAVRLAILLPLPGGIGSIAAAQVLVLELLGLPATLGLTLGLVIHGRDIFFALNGLWLNGLSIWRSPTLSTHP